MSFETDIFLACDGDGCTRRATTHTDTLEMAYLRCDEDGWLEVRGKGQKRAEWQHYCPTCAIEIEGSEGQ